MKTVQLKQLNKRDQNNRVWKRSSYTPAGLATAVMVVSHGSHSDIHIFPDDIVGVLKNFRFIRNYLVGDYYPLRGVKQPSGRTNVLRVDGNGDVKKDGLISLFMPVRGRFIPIKEAS